MAGQPAYVRSAKFPNRSQLKKSIHVSKGLRERKYPPKIGMPPYWILQIINIEKQIKIITLSNNTFLLTLFILNNVNEEMRNK